jgi:hypothetical protein
MLSVICRLVCFYLLLTVSCPVHSLSGMLVHLICNVLATVIHNNASVQVIGSINLGLETKLHIVAANLILHVVQRNFWWLTLLHAWMESTVDNQCLCILHRHVSGLFSDVAFCLLSLRAREIA